MDIRSTFLYRSSGDKTDGVTQEASWTHALD